MEDGKTQGTEEAPKGIYLFAMTKGKRLTEIPMLAEALFVFQYGSDQASDAGFYVAAEAIRDYEKAQQEGGLEKDIKSE